MGVGLRGRFGSSDGILRQGAKGESAAFTTDFDAAGELEGFAAVRLTGKMENRVNVDGAKLAGARFHSFDEEAD